MNKKTNPKSPPSYQLSEQAYDAVKAYWLQQQNQGRDIGRMQAMNELILEGASQHSIQFFKTYDSPTPRKTRTKLNGNGARLT